MKIAKWKLTVHVNNIWKGENYSWIYMHLERKEETSCTSYVLFRYTPYTERCICTRNSSRLSIEHSFFIAITISNMGISRWLLENRDDLSPFLFLFPPPSLSPFSFFSFSFLSFSFFFCYPGLSLLTLDGYPTQPQLSWFAGRFERELDYLTTILWPLAWDFELSTPPA